MDNAKDTANHAANRNSSRKRGSSNHNPTPSLSQSQTRNTTPRPQTTESEERAACCRWGGPGDRSTRACKLHYASARVHVPPRRSRASERSATGPATSLRRGRGAPRAISQACVAHAHANVATREQQRLTSSVRLRRPRRPPPYGGACLAAGGLECLDLLLQILQVSERLPRVVLGWPADRQTERRTERE